MADKTIDQLTELTSLEANDLLIAYDVSETGTEKIRKITKTNAFAGIDGGGADIYSTTEAATNKKWIDNRIIYRKVLTVAALPNTTTDTHSSGLTGVEFVSLTGFAYWSTGGHQYTLTIPRSNINNTVNIDLWADGTAISIQTVMDYSGAAGYIIMEYVKTP